jgi:hypothetical protein
MQMMLDDVFKRRRKNSHPGLSACELGHIDFEALKSIVQLITHPPTYMLTGGTLGYENHRGYVPVILFLTKGYT